VIGWPLVGESELQASVEVLLELLPEPLVVHEKGVILAANQAFQELLGRSLEELQRGTAIDYVHPDDRPEIMKRIGATGRNRRTPEHRLVHADGTSIPVEVTGVPFPYRGAMVALAIVHDLRERKHIEGELALTERMASLGRLASTVGHEINNPLTYVIGALDLLARDLHNLPASVASPLLARVEQAREGAGRVREIVRDLKGLTVPAEAATGVADVKRALDIAVATASHEIEHCARLVRADGEMPPVAASESRLVQVFVNLLVNAAQAIQAGDASSNEIRIVTRTDGTTVVVEILDTGRGFTAEEAARLFEPFFTTKHGAGAGLGLSISRRIVEGFGGSITAQPRSPRGACFRVTMHATTRRSSSMPAIGTPPPTAALGGRILFADDEPLIRNIAGPALEPFDVVTVASGREAITLLEQGEVFDVIICDLQMPDLGGADVYEWLSSHRADLVSRIVFITGGAFTERSRAFLDRVKRPYVLKPFDLEQLQAAVSRLIG
jgi:PAS domain S-box-containing protein